MGLLPVCLLLQNMGMFKMLSLYMPLKNFKNQTTVDSNLFYPTAQNYGNVSFFVVNTSAKFKKQ